MKYLKITFVLSLMALFIFTSCGKKKQSPEEVAKNFLEKEIVPPDPAKGLEPIIEIQVNALVAAKYFVDKGDKESLKKWITKTMELDKIAAKKYLGEGKSYEYSYPYSTEEESKKGKEMLEEALKKEGISLKELTESMAKMLGVVAKYDDEQNTEEEPTLKEVEGAITTTELHERVEELNGKEVIVTGFYSGHSEPDEEGIIINIGIEVNKVAIAVRVSKEEYKKTLAFHQDLVKKAGEYMGEKQITYKGTVSFEDFDGKSKSIILENATFVSE